MSSLRASATIMVLRAAASVCSSHPVPGRQTAGLLEPEETPGELDHAAAHARVARLGEPSPPPGAALLRRARQAGVAGHRPSVRRSRERTSCTSANPPISPSPTPITACQQPDHRVRPFCGCLSQSFEARLLDLGDLAGLAGPRHVASQLGERVRRQGHALRRTQRLQTPRRRAQGRPEAADAEARQAALIRLMMRVRSPIRLSAPGSGALASSSSTSGSRPCCSGPARRAASRERPA